MPTPVREALRGAGRHLKDYREIYIGGGLGATVGGAMGAGPKTTQYGAQGQRLKRPKKRPTSERILGGLTGAALMGGLGASVGADFWRRAMRHNPARSREWGARQAAREHARRTAAGGYEGYYRRHGQRPPPPSGGFAWTRHTARSAASAFGAKASNMKTQKDVRRAFRDAALRHHPDRGGNPAKMQEVNKAWEEIKKSPWFKGLEKGASVDIFSEFFQAMLGL